jgi:hypothetical protein
LDTRPTLSLSRASVPRATRYGLRNLRMFATGRRRAPGSSLSHLLSLRHEGEASVGAAMQGNGQIMHSLQSLKRRLDIQVAGAYLHDKCTSDSRVIGGPSRSPSPNVARLGVRSVHAQRCCQPRCPRPTFLLLSTRHGDVGGRPCAVTKRTVAGQIVRLVACVCAPPSVARRA